MEPAICIQSLQPDGGGVAFVVALARCCVSRSSFCSTLQLGSWESSKRLAGHLEACSITVVHHEPVAKALCKLVMKQIKPLAGALYPRGVAGKSILDEEVVAFTDAGSD